MVCEAGLEGGELFLNVEVGYGEDSGVDDEDGKDDGEGVYPFVRRGRCWLFCHGPILLLQLGREHAVYKSLLRIVYPRNGYFEYEFFFHNAYQKL